MPNQNQKPLVSSRAKIRTLKTWIFFAPSKSRQNAEIQIVCLLKTIDNIQIKIKIPNPNQEPAAFSEAKDAHYKP